MRVQPIWWCAVTVMAGTLVCCASPEATQVQTEATFVRLSRTTDGYETRVSDEIVELEQLDAAVLRRAMNANPDLSEERVREDVRIYISVRGEVPFEMVRELLGALSGFEKLGFVGEDRRD